MFDLTEEQQRALSGVMERVLDKVDETTLGGLAGTGKSTILSHLVDGLEDKGLRVMVTAPTGKAVSVLSSKGLEGATTIHSQFYRPLRKKLAKHRVVQPDGTERDIDTVTEIIFARKRPDDYDVLLVDEASMVPTKVYADLLGEGRPVVFVGDHGQLPPIGPNQTNVMANPDFKLETVHRNAGDICRFALHLRQGKPPSSFQPTDGSVVFGRTTAAEQFVCGTHKTRLRINRECRERLGYRGQVVRSGERLVSLRNAPGLQLWNGSILVPTQTIDRSLYWTGADESEMCCEYDPLFLGLDKYPDVDTAQGHPFDFGYALTCHKSQGSEWSTVAVVDEGMVFARNGMDTVHRWRYTAATRAKTKLWWS